MIVLRRWLTAHITARVLSCSVASVYANAAANCAAIRAELLEGRPN